MTIQWPNEREIANRQQFGEFSIKPKDLLPQLLTECPLGLPTAFDNAVEWIAQEGDDISELERRMSDISNVLELADFPESVNLLMTWACAEALAKTPSLQTWKNVRILKSNSWQLAHWLSDAMIVCAEGKISIKDAYIKLSSEIFEALDSFKLTSLSDRNNKEREQFQNAWKESSDQLEEIWRGLHWWSGMNYEEEFPLFQVLVALDFDAFIAVISQSENPYLLDSTLSAVGAFCKFSLWERLAVSVPSAFASDGKWEDGSVAMPLLLVIARAQLLQAGSHIPHFDVSESQVETVKQEIVNLTDAVVVTLFQRKDALPLLARWSTWLMRQFLTQGINDASNVRSSAFVDAKLIEAIGGRLKEKAVSPTLESPADAPAWEAWCYRAVLASHANNGFIAAPDCNNFLDEWAINLDDWTGERGKQLRERASLIVTMTKDVPGYAAQSLAYPIAMSKSPVDAWIALWDSTQPLREIVEFGDADDFESDKYRGSTEAGKLLWLVFCIGLAVLDQCASQCTESDLPQARSLVRLHKALALAVREMREIDYFLSREEWRKAVQQLAVRRLIWEERAVEIKKRDQCSVFLLSDEPTFSDYLSAEKNDVMELLAILQMALLNESDRQNIREKLHAAAIDLAEVVETAKRLNGISARRYPIEKSQLQELERTLLRRSGLIAVSSDPKLG